MKKGLMIIACLLTAHVSAWQQKAAVKQKPFFQNSRSYFTFNLVNGPNNSLVNFAVVTYYETPGIKPDVKFISRNNFLLQVMGKQESAANPNNENLFINHEVHDCSVVETDRSLRTTISCSIVDDLWKLKHSEYPYLLKTKDGKDSTAGGWAGGKNSPSEAQISMLKKFGVERINDFFIGENAFQLLKSMQDFDWLSRYISAK